MRERRPRGLSLGSGDVHVWLASLDRSEQSLQRFADVLSDEERARAGRFRFAEDGKRFVVGRGLLRNILARYVDTDPARLELCRSPQGKPELEPTAYPRTIRFNCSHSDGLAAYAIASGRRVGVDVERVRPIARLIDVAASVLTPEEYAAFRVLPEHRRSEAFFTRWTCKEAYLKACGAGLGGQGGGPQGVTVSPGRPLSLERVDGDPGEAGCWSLAPLSPADGFVGALAVEGHDWDLSCGWWAPA